MTGWTDITGGVPYGDCGFLLSLCHDDIHDIHDGCLCRPVTDPRLWQRGCPTTDLPAAPRWRAARQEKTR